MTRRTRRPRGWWLMQDGPQQRRAHRKGGHARALSMSPERRSEIAHVAGATAARTHRAKRLGRMVRTIRRSKEPTP